MLQPKHRVDFRYTTVKRIRDEGIDKTQLKTKDANRLIRFFSERINRWTAQWFYPIRQKIKIDGQGLKAIWRSDLMPILEKNELTVDVLGSNPSQGTVVPLEDYEITTPCAFDSPGRVLELRVTGGFVRFINQTRFLRFPVIGRFPRGPQNISFDGSFGWVIQKDKFASTSTEALVDDAKSLSVADVTGFNVGDAIRIGDADPFAYFVISSITESTGVARTINFDDADRLVATIASGAEVVTYGEVPEGIRYACERLVIEFRHNMSSPQFKSALDQSSLTGEKIGDYSYTKQQPKWKNASTTGLRDVDLVLQDYVVPNVPLMVV